MKQINTKDIVVPILRKVAEQISPIINEQATDEDYFTSFNHVTKYIRTLKLEVSEFSIIEGTIRMVAIRILSDFGHDYAVNDIEEWLLQNSINNISDKGLAN
ncbi:MAG: hypothetical protein CFE21_20025 [Bacteroidetes bacterium B1(2017)]|nr:MAG: hypothetical protein CFE21_20025 [Bacteroidetes bacterium B1(2017)]